MQLMQRFLGVTLLVLMVSAVEGADSWQTVFDEGGVLVQQRPYADSPLMEVRGVIRVTSSMNALMALLRDAPYNQHWVYRSGGASILEQVGYAQAYVYGIVDAPWPMQDRDTVVRFDYRQDPRTREIRITIVNFPDYVPHESGFVRVPEFGGFWWLRPLPDGRVEITYQVHGDPGGWVPVWMANYAAAVSVNRTLHNLPMALERYRSARSEHVLEPPADP
jgi:hypothetical protein